MNLDHPARRPAARGKRRALARRTARENRGAPRPAGASERGTVLLMILGVLALMAIIAVVYAAIGKGDRVASAAMVRSQRVDDQVDQIADYLADVVRRDVFATYAQEDFRPQSSNTPLAPRVEAFDYPSTDPLMVSQVSRTNPDAAVDPRKGYYAFDAAGTYKTPWRTQSNPGGGLATTRDPRSPSDPYLAATEPTFINRAAQVTGLTTFGPDDDYLNQRDWLHISNFAPSGNFVNLWSLRNNFRAEPGFGVDDSGRARMSSRLTLIDPTTGQSYRAGPANQNPNGDISTMQVGYRSGATVRRPRLNRPADWCQDQAGLFRTVYEPAAGGGVYTPDDPEYLPYQFADADGDGFYDSRFFELVDIADPDNPRPVVPNLGRARLFVAARCVDLTGLVNVNTACDLQFEPRRSYVFSSANDPLTPAGGPTNRPALEQSYLLPVGLTPADVDLQRLLRMGDFADAYRVGGTPAAYGQLLQPVTGSTTPGDYRAYTAAVASRLGNAAYQAIWEARMRNILPPDRRMGDPTQADPANLPANINAGQQTNSLPFVDFVEQAANRYQYYDRFSLSGTPAPTGASGSLYRFAGAFDQADELELRTFQGVNDPDHTSRLEGVVRGRVNGANNLYDLSPLRDNRPTQLERAGRDLPPPANLGTTAPGLNNEYRRALLAAQMDIRRLLTTISGSRPIIDNVRVSATDTAPVAFSEADGTIKVDGARLVSRLVETGSYRLSARPPAGGTARGIAPDYTTEYLWDTYAFDLSRNRTAFTNALDNLPPPTSGQQPPSGSVAAGDQENYTESRLDLMREAFRSYLDCLMPYTDSRAFPDAWDVKDPRSAALSYGGSAELAYRTAAHLAVNLRDMLDTDLRQLGNDPIADQHLPTAVTLDLTRQAPTTDNTRSPDYPFPKLNPRNRFDADPEHTLTADARLAEDPRQVYAGATNANDRRLNIYGIEPQPFITQVSSIAIFADTPPSALRLDEGLPGDPDEEEQGANPADPVHPHVTINVERRIRDNGTPAVELNATNIRDRGHQGNPDFICYVLAFQVANPFDTDIVLEPSDPSQNDAFYYFEYANRRYRLAEADATTPHGMAMANTGDPLDAKRRVLKAGQTKTFYATFPSSLSDIDYRIALERAALAQNSTVTASSGTFERLARHEFGEDCVHVVVMNPQTGHALRQSGITRFPDIDLFALGEQDGTVGAEDNTFRTELGDPASGTVSIPESTGNNATLTSDLRRVVNLWRALPATPNLTAATATSRKKDVLLDRLHDPSKRDAASSSEGGPSGMLVKALVEPFSGGSGASSFRKEINGTDAFDEEDQKGRTAVTWVTITRPTNPRRNPSETPSGDVRTDIDGAAPVGVLPPWCMEAKPDNVYTPGYRVTGQGSQEQRSWSLNTVRLYTDIEGGFYAAANSADKRPFSKKFTDMIRERTDAANTRYLDPDLRQPFADLRGYDSAKWDGSTTPSQQDDVRFRVEHSINVIDRKRVKPNAETTWFGVEPRRFDEVAVAIRQIPVDATGSSAPQPTGPRALFSRVGDFLLPLAIGPWNDPQRRANPESLRQVLRSDQNPTPVDDLDAQWTTLAEAVALSCDYYSGPRCFDKNQFQGGSSGAILAQGQDVNVYYRFGHDTRGRRLPGSSNVMAADHAEYCVPAGDRGQLVLDAWSPYLDYNPSRGAGQTNAYVWKPLNPNDPNSSRGRDAPLGNGIPLALNVLDRFRVAGLPAETAAKPSDQRQFPRPGGTAGVGTVFARVGRDSAYGSATQVEPGKVNINTAPLAVLRLLPLLAPSRDTLNAALQTLLDSWLYDGRFTSDNAAQVAPRRLDPDVKAALRPVPETGARRLWDPDNATAPRQQTWDVAAAAVAYRDLLALNTRRFNNQNPIEVNFRDDRRDNNGLTAPLAVNGSPRSGRDRAFSRNMLGNDADATGQGGLRDQRGFKSLGEIMCVEINRTTDRDMKTRATQDGWPADLAKDAENSITRLASDGAVTRSPSIVPASYKAERSKQLIDPATNRVVANADQIVLGDTPSTCADNYDEKLGIANAVLNTLSVRSDVFCVWFIVNGYTPEDVQVDDGAPMVPSISRRYVMVVDRSGVDSPTAKPRIVMLREVPMP